MLMHANGSCYLRKIGKLTQPIDAIKILKISQLVHFLDKILRGYFDATKKSRHIEVNSMRRLFIIQR